MEHPIIKTIEGVQIEKIRDAMQIAYSYINEVRTKQDRPFHADKDVFPQNEGEVCVWELDHTYNVFSAMRTYCELFLLNGETTFSVRLQGKERTVTRSKGALSELGMIAAIFHDTNYAAQVIPDLRSRFNLPETENGEIISALIAEEWMKKQGYADEDIAIVKDAILATVVFPNNYEYMTAQQRKEAMQRNPLAFFLATADLVGAVMDPQFGIFEFWNGMFEEEVKALEEGQKVDEFIEGQKNFLQSQLEIYASSYNSLKENELIEDKAGKFAQMRQRANEAMNDTERWKSRLTSIIKIMSSEDPAPRMKFKRNVVESTREQIIEMLIQE